MGCNYCDFDEDWDSTDEKKEFWDYTIPIKFSENIEGFHADLKVSIETGIEVGCGIWPDKEKNYCLVQVANLQFGDPIILSGTKTEAKRIIINYCPMCGRKLKKGEPK